MEPLRRDLLGAQHDKVDTVYSEQRGDVGIKRAPVVLVDDHGDLGESGHHGVQLVLQERCPIDAVLLFDDPSHLAVRDHDVVRSDFLPLLDQPDCRGHDESFVPLRDLQGAPALAYACGEVEEDLVTLLEELPAQVVLVTVLVGVVELNVFPGRCQGVGVLGLSDVVLRTLALLVPVPDDVEHRVLSLVPGPTFRRAAGGHIVLRDVLPPLVLWLHEVLVHLILRAKCF